MRYLMLTALTLPVAAQAAPARFHDCRSDIVTEQFFSCPGGEGGTGTVCGSKKTVWGSINAEFAVDPEAKSAAGSLVYAPKEGGTIRSALDCRLGDDNWMQCWTKKSVPVLGRLEVTFNIDGISPGVYFTDVFADAANVPVGGFQTALDCVR